MKILIVAVHKPLARALRRGLEEEGFDVDTAHSAEEGSEQAKRRAYDMIVIDQLPRQDFTKLLRLWRKDGITTPAILLTVPCHSDEELTHQTLEKVSVLHKPFPFVHLLNEIASLHVSNRQP